MANSRDIHSAAVFAEEDFVVDTQIFLHKLMEEKGVSRADLARAMGVSRARVTQIFSDDCKNFTVRLLARAVFALGATASLSIKSDETDAAPEKWSANMLEPEDLVRVWQIKDMFNDIKTQLPCNDQSPKRLFGYSFSPMEWEAA